MTLASRVVNALPRADAATLRGAVDGRVVVITGASFGIGRELARMATAAGARTLLVARTADALEELAAELGPGATPFACDLGDQDAVAELAEALLAAHGHVDVVVSNAGRSLRRPVADSYDRMHDFTRLCDVNYLGPVRLLLGLLPAMRERRSGHVVNVSTVGVLVPPAPRWASYVASKTAFDRWLRSVAAEMAADGVTTSSVYLPLVHTRMSAPSSDFDNVPGLPPTGAAEVVAHAIAARPVVVAPWWARLAASGGEATRRGAHLAMTRYGRGLDDRPAPRSAV